MGIQYVGIWSGGMAPEGSIAIWETSISLRGDSGQYHQDQRAVTTYLVAIVLDPIPYPAERADDILAVGIRYN